MVSYAEEMCLLQGREMLLALDGISRGKCMGRCDSIPLSIKIGFYTCSSALRWDANFLECNCSTNRRDSKRTSDNMQWKMRLKLNLDRDLPNLLYKIFMKHWLVLFEMITPLLCDCSIFNKRDFLSIYAFFISFSILCLHKLVTGLIGFTNNARIAQFELCLSCFWYLEGCSDVYAALKCMLWQGGYHF